METLFAITILNIFRVYPIPQALKRLGEKLMPILNTKARLKAEMLEPLMIELQDDCQTVAKLVDQFMAPGSTNNQKGEILSELWVTTIYLHFHCDEELQNSIQKRVSLQIQYFLTVTFFNSIFFDVD